jgi:pentatricopeptide repeat protein
MSEILLQIGRHDGNLAWRFFNWAAFLPHYQHITRPYWTIIHILSKNNKLKTAQLFLQSIAHRSFLSSPVVLDVMINDYSNLGTNSTVLSMLINSYAQFRMTEDAIQVFYQLGSYRINPTVYSCNILLNSLVKAKSPAMAWKIYREMLCRGINADSRTFNVMIHACCKKGDQEEFGEEIY